MTAHLPATAAATITAAEAKAHAARLRADLKAEGTEISHSRSLELVAHQFGYQDWNAFFAAIDNRPPEG